MSEPRPGTRILSPTLALCLALIGAASFLYYHQALFIPRAIATTNANGLGRGYSFGNDFYQVWLSCRELLREHRDPYSREMTLDIQEGLYGRPLERSRPGDPIDQRVFPYPAYTDLLFWSSAAIPFPIARVIVVIVFAALSLASVLLWLHALDWSPAWQWVSVALLLTLCSYPALEGLFAGQLGLLVAFFLSASILALKRGRFVFAGVLIALTTIKPQVTALVILYLLLWSLSRWRLRRGFFFGFFSAMAVLLATSLLVLPHWIHSWIHTVLAYRHYTAPPLVTAVVTSSLGPRISGPATLILTALSVVIAVVIAWRNRPVEIASFAFWLTLSTILAITTITILPGQAVYDHLILVPGILLLVRHRGALLTTGHVPRVLANVGLIVLLWPWIGAFGLIALRPAITAAMFQSTPLFSLPVRAAASLPFAALALLAWCWRLRLGENSAAA